MPSLCSVDFSWNQIQMRNHQLSLWQFVKQPLRILRRHFPPLVTFRTRTAARETPAFRSGKITKFITWAIWFLHAKTVLIRQKQSQRTRMEKSVAEKARKGTPETPLLGFLW